MNKKKILLITILCIFCMGMVMGAASASHTYTKGGYTFKVSDNQHEKIQKCKNEGKGFGEFHVKTKNKKTVKVPKYKTKKVTKYKWKNKYVLTSKSYYKNGMYHTKYYNTVNKYYKNGWKYNCYATKKNSNGGYNDYAVIKKKIKYTANKKIKTGYKKVKLPVIAYIHAYTNYEPYPYTTYHPIVQFRAMGKVDGEIYCDFGKTYNM